LGLYLTQHLLSLPSVDLLDRVDSLLEFLALHSQVPLLIIKMLECIQELFEVGVFFEFLRKVEVREDGFTIRIASADRADVRALPEIPLDTLGVEHVAAVEHPHLLIFEVVEFDLANGALGEFVDLNVRQFGGDLGRLGLG